MLDQLNDRINQAVRGLSQKVTLPVREEVVESSHDATATSETLLVRVTTSSLTTAANDTYTINIYSPMIDTDSDVFLTVKWGTNTQGTAIPVNLVTLSGYCTFELLNLDYSGLALAFNGTFKISALIYN